LVGVDPPAEASLWAYVLGIDLIRRMEAANRPIDDALQFMLADPGRQVRTDAPDLYLRLVDVGAALSDRGYRVDETLTLEITDRVCPWNERRWRIEARDGQARVGPTTDAPDLVLDVSALASLYLGGVRATQLHAATLIHAVTPGAVERADALFAGPRPPWNPTSF
jgi:predicted acetyltransferase